MKTKIETLMKMAARIMANRSLVVALANDGEMAAPADMPYKREDGFGVYSHNLATAAGKAHEASHIALQDNHYASAEEHLTAAKLHKEAAGHARLENKPGIADAHEGIAQSHLMCVAHCKALGNSALAIPEGEGYRMALDNEATIDDDGWCLIAPFGEWPKTRLFRENGQVKEQKFIQVLDNESADAMVGKENSFFSKLKRALVGIPVFKGHGDLTKVDPAALSNESREIKLGVVDQIRKTAKGIEAHFALDNDGAQAVKDGWKFPSGFWYVLPNGKRGDSILARPFKLISVALTQFPNISGVESLANARTQIERELNKHKNTEPDMKLIAGWLIAQGVALANADAPTESQVLEAIKMLHTSKAADVTALGNEKITLSGKISTLETAVAAEKQRADAAALSLANEQNHRKADRKAAATAITDLAILKGIITVAGRAEQITALENSAAFDTDAKALLEKKPGTKTTTNGTTESGKQTSALDNETAQAQAEYQVAFKTELVHAGQDPIKAHNRVMTLPQYQGLAAKLKPATKFDARQQTL